MLIFVFVKNIIFVTQLVIILCKPTRMVNLKFAKVKIAYILLVTKTFLTYFLLLKIILNLHFKQRLLTKNISNKN